MNEESNVAPIGQLLLVRLLVEGDKGALLSALTKALEPLLGHRWSGAALAGRLGQTLRELEAAGSVVRVVSGKGKKQTERSALTPEGRRRALAIAGLDELPPQTTWDKLKKTAIAARALGLPALEARAAKSFATENGFKAALLKARFGLPVGTGSTFDQSVDALVLKLLGLPPAPKFNIKAVKAALIRRQSGDTRAADPQPDPKKEATKLLVKEMGARQAGKDELRLAAIRHWVDGADAVPEPAPALPAARPETTAGPETDLNVFAQTVVAAARSCATGRFGDNKVFVAHVWRALCHNPSFSALGFEGFKRRLAEANNARLLDLSRADLVEAMDKEDVRLSEIPYFGATFHFVRI